LVSGEHQVTGNRALFHLILYFAPGILTGKHTEPMAINRHLSKAVLILLLLSVPGVNAYTQSAVLPSRKDSLRNDFNLLRSKLVHDYPSLYRYNPKTRMTALLDSCYSTIQDSASSIAFFALLKFLVSQIKDGHLSCSPSPELKQELGKQESYFPFRLRFINGKVYIFSASKNSLPPGTEILAINKMPVTQIKNRLFQYIVSDGYIETKKNYILGNYFYIYYFLVFGNQSYFDITYKTANGSTNTQRVEAVLESALPPIEQDSQENKLLNLSITPDHIALLTIQTFDKTALEEAGLNFEDFLHTAFTTIKEQQIKKLVIDLRHNSGGRDRYGSLLYSYLSPGKFQYYKSLTAATDQLPFEQYQHNASSFNDLSPDLLVKTSARTYQLKQAAHNNLQLISPASNNYTHEVWFLVDGLSFSVTAEFCAVARSHQRGKFIGEETGGGYAGNTSGVPIDVVLPFTQIRVSFGSIQYNMAVRPVKQPGRGIIPDYRVLPTIQDPLNKKDGQLERALEIVRLGK
jgi:hypothetical protein